MSLEFSSLFNSLFSFANSGEGLVVCFPKDNEIIAKFAHFMDPFIGCDY